MRVAFGQISSEYGCALNLISEKRVDPENEERRRREYVGAVEGAIEVALAILANLLCIFGLLSAVETPRVDWVHQ